MFTMSYKLLLVILLAVANYILFRFSMYYHHTYCGTFLDLVYYNPVRCALAMEVARETSSVFNRALFRFLYLDGIRSCLSMILTPLAELLEF